MIGKPSIKIAYATSLLIGLTAYGGLGNLSVANASSGLPDNLLSGYVYADLDINGFRGLSEPGISAVEIVLTKPSDPNYLLTTLSNQSGFYEFRGLDAETYSITQPTLPMGVWNSYVREGELRDSMTDILLSSNVGTAVLLDQNQGILPHVEGIELIDGAYGSNYNFGQVCLGKAWLITDPPPPEPERTNVPEPTTGLLLAIGGLLLGSMGRRNGMRTNSGPSFS